jgi:hypothetical protein
MGKTHPGQAGSSIDVEQASRGQSCLVRQIFDRVQGP